MQQEPQGPDSDTTRPPEPLPPGAAVDETPDDARNGGEDDRTQPPVSTLRHEDPLALYEAMPQIARLTQNRPRTEESSLAYLTRLAGSTTPEEAVTFTAFAAVPKMAIWWGYECVRVTASNLSEQDRRLMEVVARWIGYPCDPNRYAAAQGALFAPSRSPAVFLALAVAWSGGPVAPNDPSAVPPHKCPRALNSAVLSSLVPANFQERPRWLARYIEQAKTLFRVY